MASNDATYLNNRQLISLLWPTDGWATYAHSSLCLLLRCVFAHMLGQLEKERNKKIRASSECGDAMQIRYRIKSLLVQLTGADVVHYLASSITETSRLVFVIDVVAMGQQ